MAYVKLKYPTPIPPKPNGVILELTMEEAGMLRSLLSFYSNPLHRGIYYVLDLALDTGE